MSAGRTGRIEVRVTERERASIGARSRREGRTVSDFVRSRALRDDPSISVSVDVEELRSAHADLKRCGGLLNQCMRSVNRHGLNPERDMPMLISAISRVGEAASRISEALEALRG